jgi:hypothetical protein
VPEGQCSTQCYHCIEERSRKATREFQLHPLRKVAAGDARLTTRSINGVRHIQMFGADLTFCFEKVESQNRKASLNLDELVEAAGEGRVCEKCHLAVGQLIVEALPCSA